MTDGRWDTCGTKGVDVESEDRVGGEENDGRDCGGGEKELKDVEETGIAPNPLLEREFSEGRRG